MKSTSLIAMKLLSLLFLVPDVSASCMVLDSEKLVSENEHIFVGFVTDAYFKEEDGTRCGVVIGNVEPVETLKGDPDLVPTIKQYLLSCDAGQIFGRSDNFPVGQFIIVFSNGEVPRLDNACGPTQRIDYSEGRTCEVDKYRRILDLHHPDSARCLEAEEEAKAKCREINEREGQERCITNY